MGSSLTLFIFPKAASEHVSSNSEPLDAWRDVHCPFFLSLFPMDAFTIKTLF